MENHDKLRLGGNGVTDDAERYGPIGARIQHHIDPTLRFEQEPGQLDPSHDVLWLKCYHGIDGEFEIIGSDDKNLTNFLRLMPDEHLLTVLTGWGLGQLARYNSETGGVEWGQAVHLDGDSPELVASLLEKARLSEKAVHRAKLAEAVECAFWKLQSKFDARAHGGGDAGR
jgi:hypothetical protein